MNKYFTDPNETDTIDLEDGAEWIKIKKELSIGDQDRLGDMLFQVKVKTDNPDGLSRGERRRRARDEKNGSSMDATFKPSTAALLEISIVAWSFRDGTGVPLPLSRDNIDRLRPEWAHLVEERIDELNPLGGRTDPTTTEPPSKESPAPSGPSTSVT